MNEVQIMAMDNLKEQKIWLSTSSVVFKSMPLMYRISSMVAGQTIQHCSHPPREFIHGQENIRCYFFLSHPATLFTPTHGVYSQLGKRQVLLLRFSVAGENIQCSLPVGKSSRVFFRSHPSSAVHTRPRSLFTAGKTSHASAKLSEDRFYQFRTISLD